MDKRNTGSYYTPNYLARFISKRVLSQFEDKSRVSVLEPSVGDGSFVSELAKSKNTTITLTALDINKEELKKAKGKWKKGARNFKQVDFLEFEIKRNFPVVIGNPPYIKKNRLSEKQIELSKEIHAEANLSLKSVKNIWATFLIKSVENLSKNGVLAFILPSELLQITFAEELREYLKAKFERLEIFTFDDLMFECKGQDTVVLFAYKKADEKGEFFTRIHSLDELEEETFVLNQNQGLTNHNVKWSYHFLDEGDLNFIYDLKNRLHNINHYSDSKPGIVTAANDFFIVDKATEKEYNLKRHTIPIIQKGFYVNGSVVFDQSNYEQLSETDYPTKLLRLGDKSRITEKLKQYLEIGESREIPKRYKCRIRNKWYVIPNIAERPEGFFFKRSHLYPKLLKNESDAFVTDSAYKILMREGFNLNSFIYSFYNTLTLVFSELEGRYYGGGVLELTPNEFKKLPLPYTAITQRRFRTFTRQFENKENIEEILQCNDFEILNSALDMSAEEIERLRMIRERLILNRMRG